MEPADAPAAIAPTIASCTRRCKSMFLAASQWCFVNSCGQPLSSRPLSSCQLIGARGSTLLILKDVLYSLVCVRLLVNSTLETHCVRQKLACSPLRLAQREHIGSLLKFTGIPAMRGPAPFNYEFAKLMLDIDLNIDQRRSFYALLDYSKTGH
uniref:Uncharacterized protein n=1 Tax=Setaria digitata TaxID=48799 RepID=A0A915Q587_9BILA